MTVIQPSSVLFVCQLNSVRSPMAAALLRQKSRGRIYTESCGLKPGYLDGFMVAVMSEVGIDMKSHQAQTLRDLQDANFDQVIAFTEEAFETAQAIFAEDATEVLHWPMPDPTQGSLDVRAIMDQYRNVRQAISYRIDKAFSHTTANHTSD